jgi:hypothetical protein
MRAARAGLFRVNRGDKDSRRRFQPQKIFVERIATEVNASQIEVDLAEMFGQWGTVIDCKVLRNGPLNRRGRPLRVCDIQ